MSFAFKEDRNQVNTFPSYRYAWLKLILIRCTIILLRYLPVFYVLMCFAYYYVVLLIASHDIAITFTCDYEDASLFKSCLTIQFHSTASRRIIRMDTYNRTGNIRYITRILNALRLATSFIRYLRTKITEINIINIDAFELLEINRYRKEREENSGEIARQLGYHPLASYFYRRFCVYEYFASAPIKETSAVLMESFFLLLLWFYKTPYCV